MITELAVAGEPLYQGGYSGVCVVPRGEAASTRRQVNRRYAHSLDRYRDSGFRPNRLGQCTITA